MLNNSSAVTDSPEGIFGRSRDTTRQRMSGVRAELCATSNSDTNGGRPDPRGESRAREAAQSLYISLKETVSSGFTAGREAGEHTEG